MQTSFTDRHPRSLRRCPHDRMLGGVASGAADYLDLDPSVVRIAFVILAFVGGLAIPLYAAAWLLVPEEDAEASVAQQWLLHRRGDAVES